MSSLSRFLQYKSQRWKSAFILLLKKHYDNIRSRNVNSAFHRGEAHAPPHSRLNKWMVHIPAAYYASTDRIFSLQYLDSKRVFTLKLSVNRKTWLNQTSRKFLWLAGEFCIHFIHCMKTLLLHVGLNKSIAAFLCFLAASLCYISSSCSPLENALEISRETLSWIQSRF